MRWHCCKVRFKRLNCIFAYYDCQTKTAALPRTMVSSVIDAHLSEDPGVVESRFFQAVVAARGTSVACWA